MKITQFIERAEAKHCRIEISGAFLFVHSEDGTISVKVNLVTLSVWMRTQSGKNANEDYRLSTLEYASRALHLSRKD